MTGLMAGRRGLIMGVANDHSIAWGIAKALHAEGARLAFTYQGEALGRRVTPLAAKLDSDIVLPCDVEDLASVDAVFDALDARFDGGLDFVVHAIGFSDKAQLKGRYVDVTTRENFVRTMTISCFSFTEIAQRAAKRMTNGGSLLTLTYGGATRVMPNYNVMGVAKAALEASVRYLASDLGPNGIRVNALSAGPMRTLAGAGIAPATHGQPGGCRRLGPVPAVAALGRRHRRGPLRGCRLQHHLDAAPGRAPGAGRGRRRGGRLRKGRHSSGIRPGGRGPDRATPRSPRPSRRCRSARTASAEGGADG
jgi:enoyl-[acyl-carrier protein] reductase I